MIYIEERPLATLRRPTGAGHGKRDVACIDLEVESDVSVESDWQKVAGRA